LSAPGIKCPYTFNVTVGFPPLLTEDEREMWMSAPVEFALALQRPP
jgi:hypothetical protein